MMNEEQMKCVIERDQKKERKGYLHCLKWR